MKYGPKKQFPKIGFQNGLLACMRSTKFLAWEEWWSEWSMAHGGSIITAVAWCRSRGALMPHSLSPSLTSASHLPGCHHSSAAGLPPELGGRSQPTAMHSLNCKGATIHKWGTGMVFKRLCHSCSGGTLLRYIPHHLSESFAKGLLNSSLPTEIPTQKYSCISCLSLQIPLSLLSLVTFQISFLYSWLCQTLCYTGETKWTQLVPGMALGRSPLGMRFWNWIIRSEATCISLLVVRGAVALPGMLKLHNS